MKATKTSPDSLAGAPNIFGIRKMVLEGLRENFEKFRLICGIEILQGMIEEDVASQRESAASAP